MNTINKVSAKLLENFKCSEMSNGDIVHFLNEKNNFYQPLWDLIDKIHNDRPSNDFIYTTVYNILNGIENTDWNNKNEEYETLESISHNIAPVATNIINKHNTDFPEYGDEAYAYGMGYSLMEFKTFGVWIHTKEIATEVLILIKKLMIK